MQQQDTPVTTAAGTPLIEWRKLPGMIRLGLKIFFLKLVTLGIYHFWGKTETRRRIWSGVHIEGQPLEYTGLGRELFIGFLIVFFLILLPLYFAFQALPFLMMYLLEKTGSMLIAFGAFGILYAALVLIAFMLAGIAIYRARRYRLSRTRWRGIRGSMAGSPAKYGWSYFWTLLLVPFTLGWIIPWRSVKLQKRITEETRLGETPLYFDGTARPLYKPFAVFWVGLFVLFGLAFAALYVFAGDQMAMMAIGKGELLSKTDRQHFALVAGLAFLVAYLGMFLLYAFYKARELNYFAASTQFDQARFTLKAHPLSLIWLFISNGLIALLFFLLGLAVVGGIGYGLFQLLMSGYFGQSAMMMVMTNEKILTSIIMVGLIFALLGASIATPWIAARTAGYFIRRLGLDGTVDFAAIQQSQAALDRTGEGLAEGFDIDAF